MLNEVDNEFLKYLSTIRVKFPEKGGLNIWVVLHNKFHLKRCGVGESGFLV